MQRLERARVLRELTSTAKPNNSDISSGQFYPLIAQLLLPCLDQAGSIDSVSLSQVEQRIP